MQCGSIVTVDETGLKSQRYYSFFDDYTQKRGTVHQSYDEVMRAFERCTDRSVQNGKSSAEAVVLLSSGVDSAYLAVKAKHIYDRVTALTIGQNVGDSRYDEGEAAKTVAAMIDLPQQIRTVELAKIQCAVDDLLEIYPELFGDTAQFAVYLMAKDGDARADYICGEGPDSLFCSLEDGAFSRSTDEKDRLIHSLLAGSETGEGTEDPICTVSNQCEREWEQVMQALVHKTTAVFDHFRLTVKFPYLDHTLLSLCWGMPKEYLNGPGNKKRVLRGLLNEQIPYDSLHLPKRGAGVPAYQMLKTSGKDELLRLSQKEFLLSQGIFDTDAIKRLLGHFEEETLMQGVKTHGLVWRFYLFQKWYERYIQ